MPGGWSWEGEGGAVTRLEAGGRGEVPEQAGGAAVAAGHRPGGGGRDDETVSPPRDVAR